MKNKHTGTHFTVGTDGKYFQTLAQHTFQKPKNYKVKRMTQSSNQSNFNLGWGGSEFGTKYNDSFKNPFKVQKNGGGGGINNDDVNKLRKSNWNLGRMGNSYLSEFSRKYPFSFAKTP